MPAILPLPGSLVAEAVRVALAEDFGRAGDITSAAIIPADRAASAVIAARRPGIVAGMPSPSKPSGRSIRRCVLR